MRTWRTATSAAAREAQIEEMRNRWQQERWKNDPALAGLDLNSPEAKAKISELETAQQQRWVNDMHEGNKRRRTEARKALQTEFGMTDAEFTAVDPLLARVESLRLQRSLVEPTVSTDNPWARTGRSYSSSTSTMAGRRGRRDFSQFDSAVSDAERDPVVATAVTARQALATLLGDGQSSTAEIEAATTRLRTAIEQYRSLMTKAKDELRAVLTKRQEAMLIERGMLD